MLVLPLELFRFHRLPYVSQSVTFALRPDPQRNYHADGDLRLPETSRDHCWVVFITITVSGGALAF